MAIENNCNQSFHTRIIVCSLHEVLFIMRKQKKSLYVVISGRSPGIYSKWFGVGEAAEQVEGIPDAIYKGFFSREEAINWLREFTPETLAKLAPNLIEYLDEKDDSPSLADTLSDLLNNGKVVIFTDGSCNAASGVGGYGVILKFMHYVKEMSGGFNKTTNNRMEIMACIEGLKALKRKSDVIVFSDSQYVVNSISKGWAKKWRAQNWMRNEKEKAENPDLWSQLLDLCEFHTVEFQWVKGHNSTKENERCDKLALAASQKSDLPDDSRFEKNNTGSIRS